MGRLLKIGMAAFAALLAVSGSGFSYAADEADLAPYKLVRSLQVIQDQVVRGDYNAAEMQRFLLANIDKRLRAVDMAVFDDPRNVDAALIYAMSGGNPEVLDLLADRDAAGNFDNRVTSILRRYLKGQGGAVVKQLKDVVPEYRNTRIGPYLELIGANAVMATEPEIAIKFFNWARVEAPGTLIEEAAIRRSLSLTSKNNRIPEALFYAKLYARRFMASPYATQFADIFVMLAIDHANVVDKDDVEEVLALMERRRQREVYLRLARRAAINGNRELATFSSQKAVLLSDPKDKEQLALAELYSGLVNIPTDGVEAVLRRLAAINRQELSPKDRFLKDAAEIVAEEVARPPPEESLTQVRRTMVEKEYRDARSERLLRIGKTAPAIDTGQTGSTTPSPQDNPAPTADVEDFVSQGRSKLKEIDAMLTSEGQ